MDCSHKFVHTYHVSFNKALEITRTFSNYFLVFLISKLPAYTSFNFYYLTVPALSNSDKPFFSSLSVSSVFYCLVFSFCFSLWPNPSHACAVHWKFAQTLQRLQRLNCAGSRYPVLTFQFWHILVTNLQSNWSLFALSLAIATFFSFLNISQFKNSQSSYLRSSKSFQTSI